MVTVNVNNSSVNSPLRLLGISVFCFMQILNSKMRRYTAKRKYLFCKMNCAESGLKCGLTPLFIKLM